MTNASGAERRGQPVPDAPDEHRFYRDLAAWWPLISPPADYAEEAGFIAGLFDSAAIPVRSVLELGSGGGHTASHLTSRYSLTLVDLSPEMLAVSRALNPECEHVCGDMRTLRLGRVFDSVYIHDAIDSMVGEADLRSAIQTAYAHCRPGGVALFMPDDTRESFEQGTDHGGSDAADGRGARYLEWSWDPDPADSWISTTYAFLLRESDGSVRSFSETHRYGLFAGDAWLRFVADAGFDPHVVTEHTSEDRRPREIFVGHRPIR